MKILRQTDRELLEHMPPTVLFDLARNESARLAARLAAMQLLIEQQHPLAKHPNLAQLAYHVADEVLGSPPPPEELEKMAEPEPEPEPSNGVFKASFATSSMFGHEVVDNQSAAVDPEV